MKIPRTEAAYGSKAVCAVLLAFFFLTFAFDAYSIDPTNKLDFDGDGKADIAIYREGASNDRSNQAYSASTFWYWGSSVGIASFSWGRTLDVPIPADYTGDGKTDPTIFRWFEPNLAPYDGNTIWISTASGQELRGFGNTTGRKMGRNFVAEVSGPQKAEIGEFQHVNIYFDSETEPPFYQYRLYWQIGASNLDYIVTNDPLGQSAATYNQVPVPEDYRNNDGVSEVAVFNTNTGCYHVWLGSQSSPLTPAPPCFGSGYAPAPGDYDRDGWVDYAVFKSTGTNSFEWKFISSQNGGSATTYSLTTGWNGDGKSVVADYDGDGVTDYAVAQSANGNWNWTIRKSGCPSNTSLPCSPSTTTATFGLPSDTLLASPYFNDPWY